MSTTTTNYNLMKPDLTDPADITAMNPNWDIIDQELQKRPSLGEDGKIPSSQLPTMDYIPKAEKGVANGVAVLDANGQIPESALGNADVEVKGAASTIKDSNLTTNRALISNGSGKVAVSPVTSTELGYLDGVTSNVQTQLNNKLATSGGTMSASIIFQNTDSYHALHKYRTVNGQVYGVNIGCGVLGGEGVVAIEVHDGNEIDSPIIGRLEVGRLGVSYVDENNKRTYLVRSGAVAASVES